VVRAYFPAKQTIARRTVLELQLQNTGLRTVPNVAVTLDSLLYTEHYPELAANKRPVWVVERGPGATARPPVESQEVASPGGGQTAYVNTWALGPLPPRAIQTFRWIVVPVKAGPHVVRYAVAAGLAGKARALASVTPGVPPGRDTLQGAFIVNVAGTPPRPHVDPNTGRVVPGPYPVSP